MPIYKRVDKSFFKKWSPEMSYVLGFFMADGSITVNPRGAHFISIQICDKIILENMREVLDSEHKIALRKGEGNTSDIYRLQIGSKEMCNDLRKLGMEERKTYTMDFPNVPKKYFGDFVRGYFDGDGNVWSGYIHKHRKTQTFVIRSVFTSSSVAFLKEMFRLLRNKGLKGGSLCKKKNCGAYDLSFSVNDSLLLYHLMYDNLETSLFLQRKRNCFENFLKKQNCKPK
ncbi:MAG: hypothetical protein KAV41_00270 [Candidatus Pacebacteria bacterium]|nr:hypothetical protein [Candidatus Paceibacterota bacterium]